MATALRRGLEGQFRECREVAGSTGNAHEQKDLAAFRTFPVHSTGACAAPYGATNPSC